MSEKLPPIYLSHVDHERLVKSQGVRLVVFAVSGDHNVPCYTIKYEPADDGTCGDCPNKPEPGTGRENYEMACCECKRFYADLKVKP
jgi:hypothetical protein